MGIWKIKKSLQNFAWQAQAKDAGLYLQGDPRMCRAVNLFIRLNDGVAIDGDDPALDESSQILFENEISDSKMQFTQPRKTEA